MIPDKLEFPGLSLVVFTAFAHLSLGVASSIVHAFDFVGLHAGGLVGVNFGSLAVMLNAFKTECAQFCAFDGYFKSFDHGVWLFEVRVAEKRFLLL